jgi:hypothetical protein
MSSVKQDVCPVVGTTNSVLPPSHPDVDLSKSGQVCPIVGASTDHHHNLHKHPSVPASASEGSNNALECPALKQVLHEPQSESMDDALCPVVGTVTTILPPDHPSTADAKDGDLCPITKAKVEHHKGKVHEHPQVNAASGGVCPVVGAKA